jgi:hypothetical protein
LQILKDEKKVPIVKKDEEEKIEVVIEQDNIENKIDNQ